MVSGFGKKTVNQKLDGFVSFKNIKLQSNKSYLRNKKREKIDVKLMRARKIKK